MTGTELIAGALMDLGHLAPGESLSADDADLSLTRLNDWIDSLGVERLTMSYILRTTHTLTASTASYTIGSGGNINIQRPTYLTRAGIIIDTTADPLVEIPIDVLTDQEYQDIPIKAMESPLAVAVYYDHNWSAGLGRVYPYPIPNVNTTSLVVYTPQAATEFADLTTDYTFPPAWRRFYRLGLACELWQPFGQLGDIGVLRESFEQARAAVKRANYRIEEMPMDPAATGCPGGVYSIYSDSST